MVLYKICFPPLDDGGNKNLHNLGKPNEEGMCFLE